MYRIHLTPQFCSESCKLWSEKLGLRGSIAKAMLTNNNSFVAHRLKVVTKTGGIK